MIFDDLQKKFIDIFLMIKKYDLTKKKVCSIIVRRRTNVTELFVRE